MLIVHRAERSDALVAGLAEVLRTPLDDPFAAEVVAVPAKGIERWLTQRLSHSLGATEASGDGVCARVDLPSPATLVADVLAATTGIAPDTDPWRPDRLAWSVLDVVDECVHEPWCATLAGHLGATTGDRERAGRRLTTAQHLARLFDAYAAQRPAMLLDWLRGASGDGAGGQVDPDLRWQAEVWRRVREQVGVPGLAERLAGAAAMLRARPEVVDLPPRVSVFGPTRLSTVQLAAFRALAEHRDVHLWLPHPSPELWGALRHQGEDRRRRSDSSGLIAHNSLLAGLGRDARELQLRIAATATADEDLHHAPVADWPPTLLGRLQRAIAENVEPELQALEETDRSVQVHACHGPARQVEVLREVLVGLLADDPTLEPRDVLVMCPDIEDYAPLVSATFGLAGTEHDDAAHPGTRLRVRLADRSLRQTNPLLGVLSNLLDLADARVTSGQLLDLAAAAPVRRRFRIDDDDLARLQEWVAASGVRWGLDAAHRARFAMDRVAQGTWQAGLDRVLVGVAMAEEGDRWLGLALPLDDVDSSDVDLAGRLAELVDRVARVLDRLVGEQPLTGWLDALADALDLLTDVRESDVWQATQARRELARVRLDAGARADRVPLVLADVRALLADRLAGRPTRANFRTGTLTMCSMVPMRSVPHRAIALLGLDDGRFPRTTSVDGDDVLARAPCVGERDPRSEDRQLFLDAVMAAQKHLVVIYTGADPRTGQPRPPAVPVGELLDAVDAAVAAPQGTCGRDCVLVEHPLQPYDARCFETGALGRAGPFSFDATALTGARRAAQPRTAPGPFLPTRLPDPPDAVREVALDDLVRFFDAPVAGFLRQRLGLTLLREQDELADALDVELDALAQWQVGQRLLAARLAGRDAATATQAEWRRGSVPPGALGSRLLADLLANVEPLVAAAAPLRAMEADAVDVAVRLADGTRVTGSVEPLHGDVLVRVGYSRLSAKARLRSWVELLALAAAAPERELAAVTIGRGTGGVARSRLGPVDPERAQTVLGDLVALRGDGLRGPLPLTAKASATYAQRRPGMSVGNALALAEKDWCDRGFGDQTIPGEQRDPAHALVWGDGAPFSALLAEPSGDPDEPTRFAALARRVWAPLLAAEELG